VKKKTNNKIYPKANIKTLHIANLVEAGPERDLGPTGFQR
jgi:hypothetical protein